jgi:hypothetical protein
MKFSCIYCHIYELFLMIKMQRIKGYFQNQGNVKASNWNSLFFEFFY